MKRCKDCNSTQGLDTCCECGEMICQRCFYENDGLCKECKKIIHQVLVEVYGKEIIEVELKE